MATADGISVKETEESDSLKHLLNHTDIMKEVECYSKEADFVSSSETSGPFCPYFYDTLLCWPKTPAGTLALLPCFEELNGIKYDTAREYSRMFRFLFSRHVFTVLSNDRLIIFWYMRKIIFYGNGIHP
jgi:hypothetical protein